MFMPEKTDVKHEVSSVDRLVNEGVVIKPLHADERIFECWRFRIGRGQEFYACLTARPEMKDGTPNYDEPWTPGFFIMTRHSEHPVIADRYSYGGGILRQSVSPSAVREELFHRILRHDPVQITRVFPVIQAVETRTTEPA